MVHKKSRNEILLRLKNEFKNEVGVDSYRCLIRFIIKKLMYDLADKRESIAYFRDKRRWTKDTSFFDVGVWK